jgi:tetratricopeptide (TPR) repeat protein
MRARPRGKLIHYYLDDYAEARRVLAGVHDRKSPYYYLSEFVAVTIDVTEIDALPAAEQSQALKKGRARLEQFTRRYPDSAAGFNMLASMLAYLEDWGAALRALDQTKKLITPEVSKMGMFRNYTIVYTELGRHEEAINAAAEAMDYTTSLQTDPPFMLALMRSYAALGRIDEAQKVAQTLVDRVPGVHQAPEFQRAVVKMKELHDAANAGKPADKK